MMPSSYAIAEEIAHNENAVGYYGLGYISPRQKVVAVAKDDQSPYHRARRSKASGANAYPISRPLYLYTNGKPQGVVKEFIDFALSPRRPGDRPARRISSRSNEARETNVAAPKVQGIPDREAHLL